MLVYHYDLQGYFVKATQARPNPKKMGSFLIPAYSTPKAPPQVTDPLKVACFKNGAWSVVNNEVRLRKLREFEQKDAEEREHLAKLARAEKEAKLGERTVDGVPTYKEIDGVEVLKTAKEIDDETQAKLWEDLRFMRYSLLRKTDYIMLEDVPISEELRQEFLAYRQELRDIPETVKNLRDVKWPKAPEYKRSKL